MTKIKWRIYYDDGATFTDLDGSHFDAPATGVQIIASKADTEKGFILSKGKTGYYWKDGWNPCDEFGVYDYLMFHKGPKAVLFGRTIRNEDYFNIVKRATRDGINGQS